MKIGIIGAGDVGQSLAKLWIQAGIRSFSVHAIPKFSAPLFRSWGVLRNWSFTVYFRCEYRHPNHYQSINLPPNY